SSGMSSSSSGMTEDCLNGVDDDGNGLTDCADPACAAGYTCTPNPPQGWLGPVALYNGPPANKPKGPPGHPDTAHQGNTGIINDPAMCSACTCGNPTVTCTPNVVELDSDAACSTMVGSLVQAMPGVCPPILPPANTMGAKAPPPTGVASACVA